jgi:hypothetical protein
MIYMLRPINKEVDVILYICSVKERNIVYELIDEIDFDAISQDDGVIAYDDDPFLFGNIRLN